MAERSGDKFEGNVGGLNVRLEDCDFVDCGWKFGYVDGVRRSLNC